MGYRDARRSLAHRWRVEGWHGDRTVAEVLEAGVVRFPHAELVFASRSSPARLTLAEVQAQGVRMAAALVGRGLCPGDVVVMQLPSRAEWAVGWYAAMHAGLVAAPVVHIYGAAELGYIVRNAGAKALVVPDEWRGTDYLARVAAMGECPTLELVVTVGARTAPGGVRWDDLLRSAGPSAQRAARRADDPCLLLYTSGTTSSPKGVVHTSNTFLAEIDTMGREGGRRADTVFLNGGPAGHITGALTVTRPFINGSTAVSMDAWYPEDAVRLVVAHGVTESVGAPVFLHSLLDAAESRGVGLPLREFMLGAASVAPTTVMRADAAGVAGFRCYGSTEHPTVSTGHATDDLHVRAFTDGGIIAGTEVRIVGSDGRVRPPGDDGDIECIGPEQFVGYLDEGLDAEAFTDDGWFRTGDIGHVDAAGLLTITDRRKDVIIRGGENMSSKEIEDVVGSHPAVADTAVVAAPHPTLGECACAFVVLRDGATLDLPALGTWFSEQGVARQKTPERLEIVDDLPRTPSGKVRKVDLRRRLAATGASSGRQRTALPTVAAATVSPGAGPPAATTAPTTGKAR